MDTYNPFAQHQKQQGKTPGTQPTTPSQRAPMKNKQRTLTLTLNNTHTNKTSKLQKTYNLHYTSSNFTFNQQSKLRPTLQIKNNIQRTFALMYQANEHLPIEMLTNIYQQHKKLETEEHF